MGALTPNGTAIGFNKEGGQATASIDILICLEHLVIALVQPFFISIKAIEVLHNELADSYQPCSRARLVPKLGLDLI